MLNLDGGFDGQFDNDIVCEQTFNSTSMMILTNSVTKTLCVKRPLILLQS